MLSALHLLLVALLKFTWNRHETHTHTFKHTHIQTMTLIPIYSTLCDCCIYVSVSITMQFPKSTDLARDCSGSKKPTAGQKWRRRWLTTERCSHDGPICSMRTSCSQNSLRHSSAPACPWCYSHRQKKPL